MKITTELVKQLIKEEIAKLLDEGIPSIVRKKSQVGTVVHKNFDIPYFLYFPEEREGYAKSPERVDEIQKEIRHLKDISQDGAHRSVKHGSKMEEIIMNDVFASQPNKTGDYIKARDNDRAIIFINVAGRKDKSGKMHDIKAITAKFSNEFLQY